MKDTIIALLEGAVDALKHQGVLPNDVQPVIKVDPTKDKAHGDYATNLALMLAKPASMKPRELADALVAALPASDAIQKTDIAGPGFINFFAAADAAAQIVAQVLDSGDAFGRSLIGKGEKVQVEFVSANPTGPLHVGHGRGAAIGDCLCRLLEASGYDVTREFYYNDAGAQINNLALSVQARAKGLGPEDESWPADGYRGEYIVDVANDYMAGKTVTADDRKVTAKADADDLEAIQAFAVAWLRREQDLDLKAFGVEFDVYFLESSLYEDGKVEATVETLVANGHTYEQDGALWLRTTDFGDDKDRVVVRDNGVSTYFASDLGYLLSKFERGFERALYVFGADHHGYIVRLKAAAKGLGLDESKIEIQLVQFAILYRGGERVQMSTRAGSFVTLRELREEVGNDAARFFYVMRSNDQHLDFDLDLAKSHSKENPVYYIQYAITRAAGLFRKLKEKGWSYNDSAAVANRERMDSDAEIVLLGELMRLPEMVESAAANRGPQILANYLRETANAFHSFYENCDILSEDEDVRNARLGLCKATSQVLSNGLALLGVSAPERM